MLEKIREGSQGVIAKTILVLVILSFAFAGVSSYLGAPEEVPAATVNGQNISKVAFDQAYQNERSRLEQQLGEMFDTLAANDAYMDGVKQSVLQRLVAETLLDQSATKLGLRVSDEQIKQAILNEPAFQTDGKFDNERYLSILRQLNYQPAAFSETMREDMTRQQLVSALVGTEFVLKNEIVQLAQLEQQTRDIQYKVIDSEPYIKEINIPDEQVKAYYDANPNQFMTPELVSLQYVELNAADLAKNEKISDEDVKAYYEEHKSKYQSPEKRLAGHILINLGDDPDAAQVKADKIHQELVNGADFAQLAKDNSDDKFSAENGGQLDWFEKGVMDPAFDNALFAIAAKGEVSPVVKTDFGFHIIKLLDTQPAKTKPFAEVKASIIASLQEKAALDDFYQLQQTLADVSYESPDSLTDAAKAVDAKIEQTALFAKNNLPKKLNVPEVNKAIFSDTVLLNGLNSDVIELAPNHVVVLRVKEHKEAGIEPLADVKNVIIAQLTQEKANEQAKLTADNFINEFKQGKTLELEKVTQLARNNADVSPAIVQEAFKMPQPEDNKSSVTKVALPKGYAVVVLDKVNTPENIEETVLSGVKTQLNNQLSQADYLSLIESLKAKAEISYPNAS